MSSDGAADGLVVMAEGADANGLACMLAELVKENLGKPEKRADFDQLGIAIGIVAPDAEVSLTLDFDRGKLTIYDGVRPGAGLVVTTDSERITKFSLVPVAALPRLPLLASFMDRVERWTGPLALPNFFDPAGKEVVRDLISGAIKIEGVLRHPIALTRLTRLLSVV